MNSQQARAVQEDALDELDHQLLIKLTTNIVALSPSDVRDMPAQPNNKKLCEGDTHGV